MGRLDKLARESGENADESLGTTRQRVDPAAVAVQGPADARQQGVKRAKNAVLIEVGRIVRDPSQPREEFDEESLERLAKSMKTRGQLQPVRVRWDEEQGAYVMIAGERRWRAAQRAGLPTVTAMIQEGELTRGQLLAIQLVENCLRDDLRPIEQAHAFRDLMDENGWTTRQLAEELSIAQPTISQAVALLKLPEPLQEQVEQGVLAPATAYEVSKIDDPVEQVAVAEQVVAGRLQPRRRQAVHRKRRDGGGQPSTASRSVRGNCKIIVTGPASEAEDSWLRRFAGSGSRALVDHLLELPDLGDDVCEQLDYLGLGLRHARHHLLGDLDDVPRTSSSQLHVLAR